MPVENLSLSSVSDSHCTTCPLYFMFKSASNPSNTVRFEIATLLLFAIVFSRPTIILTNKPLTLLDMQHCFLQGHLAPRHIPKCTQHAKVLAHLPPHIDYVVDESILH